MGGKVYSVLHTIVGKSWWQEPEADAHMAPTVRKPRYMMRTLSGLSLSHSVQGALAHGAVQSRVGVPISAPLVHRHAQSFPSMSLNLTKLIKLTVTGHV